MTVGRNNQLVVGLLGQVCAGKSSVASVFRSRGAMVYDLDRAVHQLYTRPEVAAQVRALCGAGVMRGGDGDEVDREALGRLVFSNPEQLQRLTAEVIYPRARELVREELARFRATDSAILLLDAPTLIEAGLADLCDQVVFVTARLSRRQQWARARGWAADELDRREACLLDKEQKRRLATACVNNDGTREDLEAQVGKLLAAWLAPGNQ